MPRNCELIRRIGEISIQIRGIGDDINGVARGMECHDPQISISAISHVLVVRQDLIHQVPIDSFIHAMADCILTCATNFMAAENESDVWILTDQFCPHRVAIVIVA